MGQMKDVIMQVEQYHDEGYSADDISRLMKIELSVVLQIFQWAGLEEEDTPPD